MPRRSPSTRRTRAPGARRRVRARRASRSRSCTSPRAVVFDGSTRSTRTPTPSSHFHNAVRTARRDDPVGAVHRRARQPGHAGAVRAVSRCPPRSPRPSRRSSSRRSSHRVLPDEVAQPRRHGARARRASRRRGARVDGRARRRCRASAARPPTSCWATRSASRACRSIGTCSASPTASASCSSDDPEVVEAALATLLPPDALDARVRHAHPARPAHLQAEAAVRSLPGATRTARTSAELGAQARPRPARKRATS